MFFQQFIWLKLNPDSYSVVTLPSLTTQLHAMNCYVAIVTSEESLHAEESELQNVFSVINYLRITCQSWREFIFLINGKAIYHMIIFANRIEIQSIYK